MFPIQSTLFLIPTARERDLFQSIWLARFMIPFPTAIHLCGFGPISSGISTCQFLRPSHERVCLMGIAGTYSPDQLPVGSATSFGKVNTDCVGAEVAGNHKDESAPFNHLLPSDLQLPQLVSGEASSVFETLSIYDPTQGKQESAELLTVGIAAGTTETVAGRKKRFPQCLAEDMEGFSVALAAHAANVDCSILRGISNVAGDRNHDNWKIEEAIQAVVDLMKPLICF